jgi:8-oxo-dGTP diphosphatase
MRALQESASSSIGRILLLTFPFSDEWYSSGPVYTPAPARARKKLTAAGIEWRRRIGVVFPRTSGDDTPNIRRVDDIDWPRWKPTERATLLFVIRDARVLLIHKKTGLGAGKINGPGGRIEAGEDEMAAAVREVQEELCILPLGVRKAGELSFQFVDGYGLEGHVFTAAGYTGEPRETEEAIPLWTALDSIPYERMWADDRLWFPLLLAGSKFKGFFIFDGDAMLDSRIEEMYI